MEDFAGVCYQLFRPLQQLQNELEPLKNSDPRLFDKTVTEAIQSLMEGVNQRHVSGTAFKVSWRFED